MLVKTEGIVLKTIPYGNTSVIAKIFTREFGTQSFIIKGFYSKNSQKKYSLFQVFSFVNIVFYFKENRDLHYIKESSTAYIYQNAIFSPIKLSLITLIIEFFQKAFPIENKNSELYDFLNKIITEIDQNETKNYQRFLYFLTNVSLFLGIEPLNSPQKYTQAQLNIQNAVFEEAPLYGKQNQSDQILQDFFTQSYENCLQLNVKKSDRMRVLERILEYYRFHLDYLGKIKSIEVIQELFEN